MKLPFEPSTVAQAAGIAALSDPEFLHRSLELNARALRLIMSSLREMGFTVIPSHANFVMLPLANEEQADRMSSELLRQGVIIRPLKPFGLPHCVRISTGTDEENHILLDAVSQIQHKEELCHS